MKTLFAVLLLAAPLSAQTINDSDLASPGLSALSAKKIAREARSASGEMIFPLSAQSTARIQSAQRTVTGTLMLADYHGADHPGRLAKVMLVGTGAAQTWIQTDDAGRFTLAADGLSGTFRVRVSLDNQYWAFHNPNSDAGYEWETSDFSLAPGAGADVGVIRPAAGSENAKLAVLHLTYLTALDFLKRDADIDWWTNTLTINWPGSGDFFSSWSWSLDLTDATQWDVVTHELGHAVQFGAQKPESAGGEHKIDGCYSPALAWSEGWATFFAAAVHLKRDDADAKFEFLVPRRAPIRIENVPGDVCQGQASEWRVFAGLWDLIDTHDDGLDHFAMPFNQLWKSLRGQSAGSMTDAWALISKDLDPVSKRAAEDALIQNTLLPARAPLTVSLPKSAVDFDGRPR